VVRSRGLQLRRRRVPFTVAHGAARGVAMHPRGERHEGARWRLRRESPLSSMRWGVVHDAIENGIGESWLADDVVPAADRQLAGEQGRGTAVAILDDLERRCPGTGVGGAERGAPSDRQ
jgi:hypothetical protein